MEKKIFLILIILVVGACGQQGQSGNPDYLEKQEGIIVQKIQTQDGCQLLVIPNNKEEDIFNKTFDDLIAIAQENEGAYYFVTTEESIALEVGTRIIVYWNGEQNELSPPQRSAEKIEIVSFE